MTDSYRNDHAEGIEADAAQGEIATGLHSIPGSIAVKHRLSRMMPIPAIIMMCAIAITGYLAFGDWRWLVVLLMLIFIVATSLYTLAWLHAISAPSIVELSQPHTVSLTADNCIVVKSETGQKRIIEPGRIDSVTVDSAYLTVRYATTDRNVGKHKAKRKTEELLVPVDSFRTSDDTLAFYGRLADATQSA